jgi:hypothetical protein
MDRDRERGEGGRAPDRPFLLRKWSNKDPPGINSQTINIGSSVVHNPYDRSKFECRSFFIFAASAKNAALVIRFAFSGVC